MKTQTKAKLVEVLDQFLSDYAEEITEAQVVWFDDSGKRMNAELMARAAEIVIDAMELQQDLENRLG